MTITAIPTTYRGTSFRSRLEADWAATLDSFAIDWLYEPDGYRLPNGTGYSPDFYLPQVRVWLEVKGAHNHRIEKAREFDDALWAESGCTSRVEPDAPIVLIGREPKRHPITDAPTWINVSGSHYSAWLVRCHQCNAVTVFVPGATTCRACRAVGTVSHHFDEMNTAAFVRLPRPTGRGR